MNEDVQKLRQFGSPAQPTRISNPAWRTAEEKKEYMRKFHRETFERMKWVHDPKTYEMCKYPECNPPEPVPQV